MNEGASLPLSITMQQSINHDEITGRQADFV